MLTSRSTVTGVDVLSDCPCSTYLNTSKNGSDNVPPILTDVVPGVITRSGCVQATVAVTLVTFATLGALVVADALTVWFIAKFGLVI